MTAPRAKIETIAVAALFALGFAIVFRRWLFTGFDGVFGDEADGEILVSIVEHWHHVFAGDVHWSDPSFFYPEPGTLGYTDALFLYGVVHAALRALGLDTFTSFMIVMAALAFIGFFGFFRLARRHFGLPAPWAALGAFLFAFANMDAVKLIHAQAYGAMLLPVICDLVLTAWKNDGARARRIALAAGAGLLHGLMFFTTFQTAWFFTLFLVLFAALRPLIFGVARSIAAIREAADRWRLVAAYAAGFGAGLAPFIVLYIPVLLSGRVRDFAEVVSNAPDARDILNVTPGNWLWGEVLRHLAITGRPNRPWWEVELGYTPVVFALLVTTTVVVANGMRRAADVPAERDRWIALLGIAVLVSWLVQLDYLGWRPWAVVWTLVPGAKGIRYTFRAQIVANLFGALVVARGLEGLASAARGRTGATALVAGLALLLLVEQINTQWPATMSRRKQTELIDSIPPMPTGCRAFYLVPGVEPKDKPGYEHQADAMMISQVRGFPTVNGYSSWFPDGWDLEEPARPGYAANVRAWAARKGIADGLCGLDPRKAQWTIGLPN